jgi:hypothetical protein
MVSDCGDISFVLVKNDKNVGHVSLVVNGIVCFDPVFDDQLLKILKFGGQQTLQYGRTIAVRYKEHIRYICTNSSTSAYALPILDHSHDYCPSDNTLHLLKPWVKGNIMNCWESF